MESVQELLITGLLRGGLYALMAGGLALVFGVMNVCHFAHGEFYVIGAYIAFFAYTALGVPPLVAILIATAGAFLAGVIFEKLFLYTLRRKAPKEWLMNTFMLTAGLSIALQNSYKKVWGVRYYGITQYWDAKVRITADMAIAADRLVAFAIAIVSVLGFWWFLKRTKTGRAMRAVAQDATGAVLVGIDLNQIHTLTFALGSMLAGLCGASLLSLTPAYPFAGVKPLIQSWFVVTIIGLGNVGGAIVGGFIVGISESIAYFLLGQGWQDVVSMGLLIILLLFKPSGLFGRQIKGVWER